MICPPFVKNKQKYICHGIFGSADALLVSQYFNEYKSKIDTLVVICANAADTVRLFDEIRFFDSSIKVRILPDWETLPYDNFSPHQSLISERLATLYDLSQNPIDILLIAASTALYCLPPPKFLAAHTFNFQQGDNINESQLRNQLTLAGYDFVKQVLRPGEYCIRGNLIDLFPMGSEFPFRIDLFDNQIETIRAFDPDNQRSLHSLKQIRLLPGREFPFDEKSRYYFQQQWKKTFGSNSEKSSIYKDVEKGIPSGGIEYYLPLFFEKNATIFDYLPETCQLLLKGKIEDQLKHFHQDTKQRYDFLKNDQIKPLLPPEQLFLSTTDFFNQLKKYSQLIFCSDQDKNSITSPLPALTIDHKSNDPLSSIRQFSKENNIRILLTAESDGRRETIFQILMDHSLKTVIYDQYSDFLNDPKQESFGLVTAPLTFGFICKKDKFAIITENELFQISKSKKGYRKKQENEKSIEYMVRDLSELKLGDPVVHSQHGIGRYIGLNNINLGEGETEFLVLEYANCTKLYVPIAQLHLIFHYSGGSKDSAPLHTLGSGQWEKSKNRAAKQIRDTAADLLNLYAKRKLRSGHIYKYDEAEYKIFSNYFGFQETPDQQKAIDAVIQDMASGRLMDRLVCGDVGFGKTEVALRAAFIAALDGKQVAMLCPTTLLVEQHFQTFSDRFSRWPIKIAQLSRFQTAKENAQTKSGLADGSLDIVIGTHKLLSKSLKYKNLGLIIIDEEHRFGVQQKEMLKNLRTEVDILALTATPIPRTLGMALEGLRDFSVIATAPQKRLSIKTFVRNEDRSIIREAILRELKRGGQVYFLHNEVETINDRQLMLEELIPEARIVIAHGQMHERELEKVMRNFIEQRFNLLLCTTIIETGIDVPNANTIIIHRADYFGLAQLHQLRGRVGRSHHQAYAYLLIHDKNNLTSRAAQRLDAIQQMDELGGGFYLAMHDLEIRGAGEILGEKQSGEIRDIGFQLYTEMLANAVADLQSGNEPDLNKILASHAEINLHFPAILPTTYCSDVQARLSIYKRLSSCKNDIAINEIKEELIDRFGKLPEEASALIESHRLRLLATKASILKIDLYEKYALLQFKPRPPLAENIIQFIESEKKASFAGQDKLKIEINVDSLKGRINALRNCIQSLLS